MKLPPPANCLHAAVAGMRLHKQKQRVKQKTETCNKNTKWLEKICLNSDVFNRALNLTFNRVIMQVGRQDIITVLMVILCCILDVKCLLEKSYSAISFGSDSGCFLLKQTYKEAVLIFVQCKALYNSVRHCI